MPLWDQIFGVMIMPVWHLKLFQESSHRRSKKSKKRKRKRVSSSSSSSSEEVEEMEVWVEKNSKLFTRSLLFVCPCYLKEITLIINYMNWYRSF
jgi:hypothetical protein